MSEKDQPAGVPPVVHTPGGLPPIRVIVEKNNKLVHEDELYEEGQSVELDGPMAQNFLVLGHVRMPREGE